MRVLKALNDLVEARGGVPEVGSNGRHAWLAQRVTTDLKAYISQPLHPALCSGGAAFAEFYVGTLKPLNKRISDVTELAAKARQLAVARVREAQATAPVEGGAAATTPRVADAPLGVLVGDAVRAALPAAALDGIVGESTAMAALRRSKTALVAAQAEADAGNDQAARERVLAAGRAVRMLEAAAYGEVYVERYAKFTASVLDLPVEIQKAGAAACTCRE
jgi:hypothetical protein